MSALSITKSIGRGSRTVLLLLYIGFFVLTWCVPAFAANLKDVRAGEYKGFTRIVFELDEPAIKPDIKIQSSNQLLVTFNKTNANLVRQIPVEPSRHVDDIQFWQGKTALSTRLIFDHPHIRFESFRLSRPPRFAVDVFPVTEPAKEKSKGPAAPAQTPQTQTSDKKKASERISKQSPIEIDTQSGPAPEQREPPSESDKGAPPTIDQATVSPSDLLKRMDDNASTQQGETPSASRASSDSSEVGKMEDVRSPLAQSPPSKSNNGIKQDADNTTQRTSPPNNRLQFYLVIILVIITIAILLLLLLMLLTRHQLFYNKDDLSAAQIEQQQDKNIIVELDSN
jgi:hypothetical protein